jgi:hypothetical protein
MTLTPDPHPSIYLDPHFIASRFYSALVKHTQDQPRTQQSQEFRMGASDLGLCRSFIKYLLEQKPYDEDKMNDPKWAAFVGSAVGERLEQAYIHSYPSALAQSEFETTFPSGRVVPGHTDLVDVELNAVFDVKSKDGLEIVKAGGPSRPNRYQIATYLLGLVQNGILKPGARAFLVYVDRSGKDPMPYVVEVVVDDALITEIDEFVGDGVYAAQYGVEAPKDQPWNFCETYCAFFSTCRGSETRAEGLIEDEEAHVALKVFVEARETAKQAEERKKMAGEVLSRYSGVIVADDGPYEVSQTIVAGGSTVSYVTKDSARLNVRKKTSK